MSYRDGWTVCHGFYSVWDLYSMRAVATIVKLCYSCLVLTDHKRLTPGLATAPEGTVRYLAEYIYTA